MSPSTIALSSGRTRSSLPSSSHPARFRAGLAAACAAAALACTGVAHAGILVQETFNYPAGAPLDGQNGGTGFSSAYGTTYGAPSSVGTGSLTYPGVASSGNSALAGGGGDGVARNLTSNVRNGNTTLYGSFLINPGSAGYGGMNVGGTGSLFVGYGNGTFDTERLGGGDAVSSGITATPGVTAFLVFRIDLAVGGGNDAISLYVNPTAGGAEPAFASATNSIALGDLASFGFVTDGTTGFDEFRLGTTYADVTSAVPEPSAWAAVAAGAGLLGAGVLRRRSKAA